MKPGETIDESMRRSAVQLHRPGVPHRAAAEPRRHQPHLFVLLSRDPARQRPLPDRLQHQRQLRRLGRPVDGRLRGQQARPDRDDARRVSSSTCPTSASKLDHVEAATPLTFEHYTQALARGQLRHQVRGAGRQPRPARADRRAVPRRQRGHHHVGLAGRGQLRRDRGQRRRRVPDEQRVADQLAAVSNVGRRPSHEPTSKILRRHPAPRAVPAGRRDRRAGPTSRIVCTQDVSPARRTSSPGHYPGYPLVPGVLLCEAAMQAGAILLSRHLAPTPRARCRWPRG